MSKVTWEVISDQPRIYKINYPLPPWSWEDHLKAIESLAQECREFNGEFFLISDLTENGYWMPKNYATFGEATLEYFSVVKPQIWYMASNSAIVTTAIELFRSFVWRRLFPDVQLKSVNSVPAAQKLILENL